MKNILISFFLFLLACSPVNNTPANSYQVENAKVIDGDTIELPTGQRLRYIGIDTPEIGEPFAQEAKQFNQALLKGNSITISFDKENTDKYGRLLGYCFIGETFINAELVKEGLAVTYNKPPNVKYAALLNGLQNQAKKEKKGLWRKYETIPHTQAYLFIGQIRTVTGKVIDTYQSKKCVYLNFGEDYKTDFTIVIFSDCLDYFHKENINPSVFYKNKTVEITGKIREYNGPEIIAHIPEDINITPDT